MSEDNNLQKSKKSGIARHILMFGGVLVVLLVCAWFYLTGGRYIATDNAYIKAAKILEAAAGI